jgi:putative DNA methylase
MIAGFTPTLYGMTKWGDLFTPRQLVALTTFSDLVQGARERVRAMPWPLACPTTAMGSIAGGTGRPGVCGRSGDIFGICRG